MDWIKGSDHFAGLGYHEIVSEDGLVIALSIFRAYYKDPNDTDYFRLYDPSQINDRVNPPSLQFTIKKFNPNGHIMDETDLHKLETLAKRVGKYNDVEFQAVLTLFQADIHPDNVSKTSLEKNIENVFTKLNEYLEPDPTVSTMYVYFMQSLKLELFAKYYEKYPKDGLPLIFKVVNEVCYDLTPWNYGITKISDIDRIFSYFIKSLLLEPYGYYKDSVLQHIHRYYQNVNTSNVNRNGFDSLGAMTAFEMALGKIWNLSSSECHELKKMFPDEDHLKIAFGNIVDMNIIFASRKFSTVRLSTLYSLFGLKDNEFTADYDLLESVERLSQEKKIVVKINEADGILTFPLVKKTKKELLDNLFSNTIPRALDKDWDTLIKELKKARNRYDN